MKKNINIWIASLCLLLVMGCKKFLDEKPDDKLSTIESIQDMQALLDNYTDLNQRDISIAESGADNYFITEATYNILSEYDRNLYIWAASNVTAPGVNTWLETYMQVNIANNVLKAVNDRKPYISDKQKLGNIEAQALFFRAKCFLNAMSIWAMPYDANTAESLPGIPLRLDPDFNQPSKRESIKVCYQRIIEDFQRAIPNLQAKDIIQTRPSKAAAYGMLSRTYLWMLDYVNAGKYADSSLQINSNLLNYNNFSPSANYPFASLNAEVSYEGMVSVGGLIPPSRAMVNLDLYNQYTDNDLRKTLFFKASGNNFMFKGSYEGSGNYFNGISTSEMLLNRSECYIRNGNIEKGLEDLNRLLLNRFKTGTFFLYSNLNTDQALDLVKRERRKELAFRCLRWMDIRRFNQEGDNIILKRTINNKEYYLRPNSLLYAIAIPEDIITLSGIEQNKR